MTIESQTQKRYSMSAPATRAIGRPMGPVGGSGPPPPMSNMFVSLSQLVDLTIYKAYHELTVLAEILSGKTWREN